jgi:hypothetical protein
MRPLPNGHVRYLTVLYVCDKDDATAAKFLESKIKEKEKGGYVNVGGMLVGGFYQGKGQGQRVRVRGLG